jgi:hypothetical protein
MHDDFLMGDIAGAYVTGNAVYKSLILFLRTHRMNVQQQRAAKQNKTSRDWVDHSL